MKTAYVGIDYHVKQLTIAVMIENENTFLDTVHVDNNDKMIKQYLQKLSKQYKLKICYEASSSGYTFQRKLNKWGYHCDVIAPSLVPRKPGNRRKNDFRDVRNLTEFYKDGKLTIVHPPTLQEEAVRTLIRCRLSFKKDEKNIKLQINCLLLSQGHHWKKSKWTRQHRQWIRRISFTEQCLQQVLEEYLAHLEHLEICVARLDARIEQIAESETYAPSVKKLRALKGMGILSAMILIAEITDFRRFPNPRALMAFLGLIPSENTSSDRQRGGPITKTGNRRCRTQLIESVRHYIKKPRMSAQMKADCALISADCVNMVQGCMRRLHKRYWALVMKGKHHNLALTANLQNDTK